MLSFRHSALFVANSFFLPHALLLLLLLLFSLYCSPSLFLSFPSSFFPFPSVVKCHDGPKKVKTRPTSHMALGMNQRRPQSNLVASPPPSTPSCPVRASPSPSPSSPSPVSPSPVSPSSSPSPSSPSFASFSRPMSSEDVESEDDLETFVFEFVAFIVAIVVVLLLMFFCYIHDSAVYKTDPQSSFPLPL